MHRRAPVLLLALGCLFTSTHTRAGVTVDLRTDSLPTWYGGVPLEEIGWSVAAADLDGDGVRDIVFTAAAASPLGRFHAGEAYLLWGGPPRYPDTSFLDAGSNHDVFVAGGLVGGELGYAIGVGDVDGDGKQDLLLGERGGLGPTGQLNAGRAWLLWGDTRASIGSSVDLATADGRVLKLVGVDAGDMAGYNVDLLDWNGDGKSDILVCAPYANGPGNARADCGEVRVIYGRSRGQFGSSVNLGQASDVVVYGPTVNGEAGLSIGGGDVDGNGVQDLLVGVPRASNLSGDPEAGQVRALFGPGPPSGSVVDLATQSDMRFYGEQAQDHLGGVVPMPFQQRSVAGLDWDGDGYDDVVMAATQADPMGRGDAGIVYVFFGAPRVLLPTEVDLFTAPTPKLKGPSDGSWLGLCIVGDDFDLDGRDDLAVTAPRADGPGGRTQCGQLFVLAGRPRAAIPLSWDLATDFDLRYVGADSGDLTGVYAFWGDVDGDWSPDLLFAGCAARGPDNAIPVAGEVYLDYSPSLPTGLVSSAPPLALRRTGRHPARGPVALALDLPERSAVKVEVLDLMGRRMATLYHGVLEAGSHSLVWAPGGSGGARAGVYFVTVRAATGRASARIVVLE